MRKLRVGLIIVLLIVSACLAACGRTECEKNGHNANQATCTTASICTVCKETLSSALKHNYDQGVCTRCSAVNPDYVKTLEYTRTSYNKPFTEPNAKRAFFSAPVNTYTTTNAQFFFDTALEASQTDAFVNYAQQALSRLNTSRHSSIFVIKDYDSYFVNYCPDKYTPPQLCVNANNPKSTELLTKLILLKCGAHANYGAVFGYANWLYAQLGWGQGYTPTDNVTPLNSCTLDLNYLCFNTDFTTEEDITAAQNLAVAFVNDYLASHTEQELIELLTASGRADTCADFYTVLQQWYATREVDYLPATVAYASGGLTNSYMALNNHALIYMKANWEHSYYYQYDAANYQYFENYLQKDYSKVRYFFEAQTAQMNEAVDALGVQPSGIDMVFLNLDEASYDSSVYMFSRCEITRESAFLHEYIHSVTYNHMSTTESWAVEAVAMYYMIKYDAIIQKFDNEIVYKDDFFLDEQEKQLYEQLVEIAGNEISPLYHRLEADYSCWALNQGLQDNPHMAGVSFYFFLVEQYGETAVRDYFITVDGKSVSFDKDLQQLVTEWQNYLEEEFADKGLWKPE